MDTPKISQMWQALQQTHKLPGKDVLSGAEDELQELMRQIDIMVHNRKAEWEKEKHALMTRLDVQQTEHLIQSSTLKEKHNEIGLLKTHLGTVEDSHRNAALAYEKQLGSLQDQFCQRNGMIEVPCFLSAFPCDEDEEIAVMKKEFEKLYRQFNKKAKHAETEQQRSSNTVQTNAAEVKRLNTKLEDFRKRAKEWEQKRRGYDKKIEDLQKQMEALLGRQEHDKKLEDELEQLSANTLSNQKKLTDQQQLVGNLEENIIRKDIIIRRSEEARSHQDEENKQLKSQLEDLHRQKQLLKTQLLKKTDQRTMEELHREEIDGMKREMSAVAAELHEKVIITTTLNEYLSASEKQLLENADLLDQKQAELQVTHAQLYALRLENQHLLRRALTPVDVALSDAEHDLNELKDLQAAYSLSIASLEDQNARLTKDLAQLKECLALADGENIDKMEHTLATSQRTIQKLKQHEHQKIQEVEEKSRKQLEDMEHRLNTTVEQYENQIDSLQLKMSVLKDNIDVQHQSMKRLGLEHDVMTKFVNGVDHMIQPALCQEANNSTSSSQPVNQNNTGTDCSMDIDGEIEDDYLTDTADTATAKFVHDQEERTRRLEAQLDNHIMYLKSTTDKTVKKFAVRPRYM